MKTDMSLAIEALSQLELKIVMRINGHRQVIERSIWAIQDAEVAIAIATMSQDLDKLKASIARLSE